MYPRDRNMPGTTQIGVIDALAGAVIQFSSKDCDGDE